MDGNRHLVTFAVAVALALAACAPGQGSTGGGGGTASPTPTGGAVEASSSAGTSGAPQSSASGAPTDDGEDTGSEGGLPDDACQLLSTTDVQKIFGGMVTSDGPDDDGFCVFFVEEGNGLLIDFASGQSPVLVGFTDSWGTFEEARAVMGDDVRKVEGLGTDAWAALGAIHAKVPGGELVVSGIFGEIYDQTVINGEMQELTKLVLGRL
jgi:hypothetical protein